MITTTTEVADNIFRISTFVPDAGMSFNQILVKADEPLLFHTGMRALFPTVSDAVSTVLPVSSLRWIGFGHVEADECGAMNQWLDAAEDMFGYSSLAPSTVPTVERLAELAPTTLALVHGPTYQGDGALWLRDLATEYRRRSELTLVST
jgi:hypothetical protein